MMENYIAKQSKYTPSIEFDISLQTLTIKGESYPENAIEVYQPLINTIDQYFSEGHEKLHIELNLDYLNTSSSKMMTDFIGLLQKHNDLGAKIDLLWYYPFEDEDCREMCEVFLEDVSFDYQIKQVEE
jgi:hypothetical protein